MGLFTPIQSLLGLANTWASNQTFSGTNNTAPNQSGIPASGSTQLLNFTQYNTATPVRFGADLPTAQICNSGSNWYTGQTIPMISLNYVPSSTIVRGVICTAQSLGSPASAANFSIKIQGRQTNNNNINNSNTWTVPCTSITLISGTTYNYYITFASSSPPASWSTRLSSDGILLVYFGAELTQSTGSVVYTAATGSGGNFTCELYR